MADDNEVLAYLNDLSPEERTRLRTVMEGMLDRLDEADDLDPTESAALSMETNSRALEADAIAQAAQRIADAAVQSAREQAAAVAEDMKAQAEERDKANREAAQLDRMAEEGTKGGSSTDDEEDDTSTKEDNVAKEVIKIDISHLSDEFIAEHLYHLIKASFSDSPWSTPESDLTAEQFCSVCLIDDNPAGSEKVKSKCHLPVRSRPGAPVNRAALRNASARLSQTKASSESKAAAKRKLARLMAAAGIESSLNKATDDDSATFSIEAELIKDASNPDRIAIAVAYPNFPDGEVDTQGDAMTPREIELMAHRFMKDSRAYDIHHTILDVPPEDAAVVESYIAPVDFTVNGKSIRKGSWVVATQFSPLLWDRVIKGEIRAYSIRGRGKRSE